MRWRYVAVAVAVVGVGTASLALWPSSGSSLDADERAVVEQVESRSYADSADAARFVEDNIEILLSEDVAAAVDAPGLAALFESALHSDRADAIFETVVAEIGEEDAIHSRDLRPVFGEAAADRVAWLDPRINAPFIHANVDRLEEVRGPSRAAHAFLREVMRDPSVGEQLRHSMAEYGRVEVAAAPAAGEERNVRLLHIGRVQGSFTGALYAAEVREARVDENGEAEEDAEEADQERRADDAVDQAMWVAFDRFESDPAVRAEAVGEPFADADGALKDDLTERETNALRAWATNQALRRGLFYDDVGHLVVGNAEVRGGG